MDCFIKEYNQAKEQGSLSVTLSTISRNIPSGMVILQQNALFLACSKIDFSPGKEKALVFSLDHVWMLHMVLKVETNISVN